jgi:hypothetical protein
LSEIKKKYLQDVEELEKLSNSRLKLLDEEYKNKMKEWEEEWKKNA